MCDESDETNLVTIPRPEATDALAVAWPAGNGDLVSLARHLCDIPEQRSAHLGSIGYGSVRDGDRVLIAVDNYYDDGVVAAVATALRERGARVDVHWHDAGPDRRFGEADEIGAAIRRRPWTEAPRRWEGDPLVEQRAAAEGFDLLIHGRGGPTPRTSFRYEQFPWVIAEHFGPDVVGYPSEIIAAAAQLTWDQIWQRGRNGRVRVTDREGTDFSYTLDETYWDGTHHGWVAEPKRWYGHLFGHPTPPLPRADAHGVVKGTTSHFSRAFPQLTLQLADGQVQQVSGGGGYGEAWAGLLEETRQVRYPGFARPGLFHLWEVAIGGHPKVRRPSTIEWWSSGGFEWERRRSGVIHLGFGTFWRGPDEAWAAERGLAYGHLHVHLLFGTFELTTSDGEVLTLIADGRLTALDDPTVRAVAERYGDPDVLLRDSWVPSVPGITAPGDYAEFARDPAAYIYSGGPA